MLPIRIKACSESDLRMLGNLARNIQRVLPVTQADIDAAAALGKGWVVWKVVEVNDPIDNLRGGTQLVIKQNSITPGQNVRRVLIVSGPGGETVVIGPAPSPLLLPDAIADSLTYVKAFGGTEQRNLPDGYTQLEYIETDGNSYIDTNLLLSNTSEFEITFKSADATLNTPIMGAISSGTSFTSTNNLCVTYTLASGLNAYAVYCNGAAGDANESWNAGDAQDKLKHTVKYNGLNIAPTLDGVDMEQLVPTTLTTNTPTVTTWLFGRNNTGSGTKAQTGVRIYDFKVVGIAHFIPCKNASNVVGMYDIVSGQFFTNAGTGDFTAGADVVPTPDAPMDIVSNNGVLKANKNLYWTEYNGYELSQVDGITLRTNSGVNVSGMVDCRTIKSFKITTASPQGSFRIFKYRADNTYIDANSTAIIGDIITLEDNVGFFRIQYNFTNSGTGTQNILIYNSAYDLNGIYADGTVETINVHGKNLFDKEQTYISAFVNSNTGVLTEASPNQRSFVIGCLPNTTYTLSGMTAASGWGSFTSSTIGTTATSFTTGNGTITTGANDKYLIGLAYVQGSSSYDYRNTLQIELGSTATAYVPYYNGGTATAEMLLKVDDYQDEQEILSGAVTRNIGVLVLDGTEDWSLTNNSFRFDGNISFAQPNTCLCTHFVGRLSTDSITAMPDLSIKAGHPTNTYRVYLRYDRFTTIEQLKSWLADQYANGTPVIVVYPLATATTESVAGQTLQVTDGDNVVEITQASLSGLELEAEYQKVA